MDHKHIGTPKFSETLQGLPSRLIIVVGLILPLGTIIAGAGLVYFIRPVTWGSGLLFGGGLLLIGLSSAWLSIRTVNRFLTKPPALETESPPPPPPAAAAAGASGLVVNSAKEERAAVAETRQDIETARIPREKESTAELRYANDRLQLELDARQQAEAALRESEARYRQLVEFSPDGIVIHRRGEIAYINAAATAILGGTQAKQLLGKPVMDFVHPDYITVVERRIQQIYAERKELPPIEQKYIKLDGKSEIDAEVTAIPFVYRNEPAVQLVIRDITKRKKAQAEIIRGNRELTILQSAGVAITSNLDLRYVLNTVTQEMTKLLEIESCAISEWNQKEDTVTLIAEYRSNSWWDPKSDAPVYRLAEYPLTQEVLDMQSPQQMTLSQAHIDPNEATYMRQAGIKTLMLLPMIFQKRVLGLMELEDSRVERTFSFHEIALAKLLASQAASAIENARVHTELRQRVAELTTLNEIGQAIVSTLDLQEMLTIVNNHIAKLMDVAANSVTLYDEIRDDLWFAAAFGEGSEFIRGKRLAKGEGIVGWVIAHGEALLIPDVSEDPLFYGSFDVQSGFSTASILCVPLQTKSQTIGAIEAINKLDGPFTQEDLRLLQLLAAPAATAIENALLFEKAQAEIQERQRAEMALEKERALLAERVRERTADLSKANAELAKASRLKDEFLAGMSHELRTPLNTILGSSEILQAGAFGELNERQDRYAHNIEESGRHLLALINDILDLSKIEAGKVELEIRPVAIQSVCEASIRLVKQLAHKKQLKLVTDFNNSLETLQADERRLKQILVNLLSNAIKFTPEAGQVGLQVDEDAGQQVVCFTVWDTGIGISDEDMQRLFQPFVQLDSSLSRQYAGTGLGLSLVSRMVELHGGGVAVESEVDQGSRFTISLPYSRDIPEIKLVKPDRSEKPALPTKGGGAQTNPHPLVLITDDNEDNIDMLWNFLEAHGYRVVAARSGQEAIERTREERPDIILMDIQMPGMNGLETTRQMRTEVGLAQVPIIALTALAMPGDRQRCLEAGADEYLSKPVSPVGLIETMEKFLYAQLQPLGAAEN